MSGSAKFLKTTLIPAAVSLVLYLVLTFAILPFYRRYRQRYSQYLPLSALSTQTASIRERISDSLMQFLLPISWRRRTFGQTSYGRYTVDSDGSLFDEEEGEGMVGFDIDASLSEAPELTEDANDSGRRLSRELEEGFRDDSDDDDDNSRRDQERQRQR